MKKINLFLSIMFIGALFTNSFTMKKIIEKEVKKEEDKITIGEKVFNSLADFVKNSEKERRKKIIENVSKKITYFSLYKVNVSKKEISQELKGLPYVGVLFRVSFISSFTNFFCDYLISKFVDFDEVDKNKDKIKGYMQEALYKDIVKFKILGKKYKERIWFKNKITDFGSKKEEYKKIYTEMLCLAVHVVKNNKTMFEDVLKVVKAEKYSNLFFKALCEDKDLENKIKTSCYRD